MAWLLNGWTLLLLFFFFKKEKKEKIAPFVPCASIMSMSVKEGYKRTLTLTPCAITVRIFPGAESTTWVNHLQHMDQSIPGIWNPTFWKTEHLVQLKRKKLGQIPNAPHPVFHTCSTPFNEPSASRTDHIRAVYLQTCLKSSPKDQFGLNVLKIHHHLQNGDQTPWSSDARLPLMEGWRTILPPPQHNDT